MASIISLVTAECYRLERVCYMLLFKYPDNKHVCLLQEPHMTHRVCFSKHLICFQPSPTGLYRSVNEHHILQSEYKFTTFLVHFVTLKSHKNIKYAYFEWY